MCQDIILNIVSTYQDFQSAWTWCLPRWDLRLVKTEPAGILVVLQVFLCEVCRDMGVADSLYSLQDHYIAIKSHSPLKKPMSGVTSACSDKNYLCVVIMAELSFILKCLCTFISMDCRKSTKQTDTGLQVVADDEILLEFSLSFTRAVRVCLAGGLIRQHVALWGSKELISEDLIWTKSRERSTKNRHMHICI